VQACSCGVWPAGGARISPETRISAIERLNEQGKSKLVVRGGEPLLHWEELLAVLRAASRLGMSSEIHSTGILLNQRRIEELRGIQVGFALLLAADTEAEFDCAVGRGGAWSALQHTIQLLRGNHIAFTAKIPVSIRARQRIESLAEWAAGLGASSVEWLPYALPGDESAGFRAWVSPSSPQTMAVGMDQFFANAQCQSCFANKCFIAADGSVTPCIGVREPVARLGEMDITQVLHEDRLGPPQESTARRQMPECARCEFRFGCCSCLVRTTELRGSARARHWDCSYDPESAAWV
jgi:radical SAM protein with 4Fe4S-binding SPASM domain